MHLKTPCNSIIAESPPLLVFLTNKQEESPKWDTPRGRESLDRLKGRGYGLTLLLVPNYSEENRDMNRMVEFKVLKK
jgi:hypothetical protein